MIAAFEGIAKNQNTAFELVPAPGLVCVETNPGPGFRKPKADEETVKKTFIVVGLALKILDEVSKEANKNGINDVEWVCNNERYKDFEIHGNVAAITKIQCLPLDCIKLVSN